MGEINDEESLKDVENGLEDLQIPLVPPEKKSDITMVLLCTLVAVCGSFEFGSCVGYSAPVQSAMTQDLNLSIAEFSMFGSILTIGAMLGAISSGPIADLIGRKGAMRLSACFCIVGWLVVYFSKSAAFLDMARAYTGYGIGILSYVIPVYIGEIAPKNVRGRLGAINEVMIVCGSSTAFLLGTVITWRQLSLTAILPCIFLLIGLFFVPESPRWLAKVGNEKDFFSALQKLRGKEADISDESTEIQVSVEILNSCPKARVFDLFQTKYIRSVIIGVGLMVFQQFSGINGIGFYAREIFAASAGPSLGKMGTIVFACVQVPIAMAGAVLIDKFGRRPLITVSAFGACLGSLVTGTSFFMKVHGLFPEYVPYLTLMGIVMYVASYSIGLGGVPWVVMSEIFPIHIKGVAGSLVVLVNWLCAWAVSYTFNFLMNWSSSGTFFMYSVMSLLAIIFVAKLVPETKGKTLEEIQASMHGSIHPRIEEYVHYTTRKISFPYHNFAHGLFSV